VRREISDELDHVLLSNPLERKVGFVARSAFGTARAQGVCSAAITRRSNRRQ
jgi:hypothetical protein